MADPFRHPIRHVPGGEWRDLLRSIGRSMIAAAWGARACRTGDGRVPGAADGRFPVMAALA